MKWHGGYWELKAAIARTAYRGRWVDGTPAEFRGDGGEMLRWWSNTRTVVAQGANLEAFEQAVRAEIAPRNLLFTDED